MLHRDNWPGGRVCWHDLSLRLHTNQKSPTETEGTWLKCTWVKWWKWSLRPFSHCSLFVLPTFIRILCYVTELGLSSNNDAQTTPWINTTSRGGFQICLLLPVLGPICVAVFVCDYVFHQLQLLFALNLPVFTMNLCLYICWHVCNDYFLFCFGNLK